MQTTIKLLIFMLTVVIFSQCEKDPINGKNDHTPGIIHVPGDQPTIQEAINAASDGDTVLVAEDRYYENISFTGKAIIVASQFLMDGNESHISNTIIDGSQPSNPDRASVVSMRTNEDTTSVLYGFTITGGGGSSFVNDYGTKYYGGGGVSIIRSGGKIVNNIIEDNHLTDPSYTPFATLGAGINVIVSEYHTAIIRNNIVRNNSYYGNNSGAGGGMNLGSGRLIVEGNTISGNILNSEGYLKGGGIFYARWLDMEPAIDEVVIRNNIITGNEIDGGIYDDPDSQTTGYSHGGGMVVEGYFAEVIPLIYNNLIADNNAHDGMGGGIAAYNLRSVVFMNNTVVNNKADKGAEQIGLAHTDPEQSLINVEVILINNILWSDTENDSSEMSILFEEKLVLNAMYNNIHGGWEGEGNIDVNPWFEVDSYNLSDSSLCIGNGVASIEIDGTWYHAPSTDLFHNIRPYSCDNLVDLGAIESSYPCPGGK